MAMRTIWMKPLTRDLIKQINKWIYTGVEAGEVKS